MNNNNKYIIFDCGGVLGCDMQYIYVRDYIKKNHSDKTTQLETLLTSLWQRIKSDHTYSDTQFFKDLIEQLGIKPTDSQSYKTLLTQFISETNSELHSNAAVLDYVKILKDKGYKLCILSNHAKEFFQSIWNSNPLFEECFVDPELVVISCYFNTFKPKVDFYDIMWDNICKKHNQHNDNNNNIVLSKSNTIFFDDKIDNVNASISFGIPSVQFNFAKDSIDKIEQAIINQFGK